ncbi:TPA: tail fiber domain-containing protein [Citrobacter freundii]|nr:tail fiber domain-containing protein [Citrobacter freundii]HBN5497903.1 tail fiber domain-containing protein [Citrobacter freundii]HBU9121904.1 tail fiber domain-containing protein [Citrobacter freundii]
MSDITANAVVSMPSQLFTMPRSFKAVANGKIYIGQIDTDPVNPANQIPVYLENENGSHVQVSQPIVINSGGFPVYNGQVAKFVTVHGHSMAVYDAYNTQQFYFPNILKYDPDQLEQRLSSNNGTDYIGYPGYPNLTDFLHTTIRTVEEFRDTGFTDAQTFQAAVNAGSVRVPAGTTIEITGNIDITIPGDRLILVETGGAIKSNGRFTAYGVNNVHWIVNGLVECTGMIPAPAKSGWPNTAAGTQAGDERGFIEFGGVVFAGNDGSDYSVTGTGRIQGYWSGAPNNSDLVNQVNRKGIAAWNCSRFTVKGVHIDGFEGEQVYWFSRNANNRDALFDSVTSTNARFNALNMNVYSAIFNIVIRDCYTNVSYNGIESSAGDIINTTHDGSVNSGILFGLGTGGGKRLIDGNTVNDCLGTPYSLLYDKNYESRGYIPAVTITNNVATNPANHFINVSGISGLKIENNTCYGLKAGKFIQATVIEGGAIKNNTNYNPASGTQHVYQADCYSVFESGNDLVTLGGSYASTKLSERAITGGLNSSITAFGIRENFHELRGDNPQPGSGPEYRFSYDTGVKFVAASISSNLSVYDGAGASASLSFNSLKVNNSDVLGQSWEMNTHGYLLPGTDGTQDFGSASRRVNASYFTVAPVISSDGRIKQQEEHLDDAEKRVALKIKSLLKKYKLKDSVLKKGDNARTHMGVIAQDVRGAFLSENLDPHSYALFCYDEWDESPEIVEEDECGKLIVKQRYIAAGNRYSIRYEELLCFIIAAI